MLGAWEQFLAGKKRMIKLLSAYFKKDFLEKPIDYIIFVTNVCNSRCIHCFNWKNINKQPEKELTFEELRRFSAEIGKIRNLGLSGGEVFLRKDLPQIISLFSRVNQPKSMNIPTNCLLGEKIAIIAEEFLKEKLPVDYTISLSLDGLKQTHEHIRGIPGNFERVFKTYKALLPLKKKYQLKIKVSTTLNNLNINEIEELGAYVKKNMPQIDFHNFEIMRGSPKEKTLLPPSYEELIKLRPIIFKIWQDYQFYGKAKKSLIAYQLKKYVYNTYLEIIKEKKQVVPCLAYAFDAVLDAYGNVYFCELLPTIGNIRKQSFTQILKSPAAKKQRVFIRKGCCYCTHSCFMQKSIFLNPGHYVCHFKNFLSR